VHEVLGLNVAALAPHKAQSDLLRAAALARSRAPNLRIWIAGEGPLERTLLAERDSLGLQSTVRFLGFRNDVQDLLRAADFFCISSRLEGMGTSILEAMAAGLPVVATRAGGIPEIVDGGRTGDLVPPGDPAAFADGLVTMATHAERRATMGARASERARDFSADRTAAMTRKLYLYTLQARPRRPLREVGPAPVDPANSTC
jgi:glycosyltransferase involved in cell wall biosynthesis